MRTIPLLAAILLATTAAALPNPEDATPFASAGAACMVNEGWHLASCAQATVFETTPCAGTGTSCSVDFDIRLKVPANACASLLLTERFSFGSFDHPIAAKRDTCHLGQLGEFGEFRYEITVGNAPYLTSPMEPSFEFTLCVGDELYYESSVQCETWTHHLVRPYNL